jgi:hypothetical protein
MANETTIKIVASADGKNYSLEIVEAEAKTGDRIDQRTAQMIKKMDDIMRDPQFMQAYQQMARQQQSGRFGSPMPLITGW